MIDVIPFQCQTFTIDVSGYRNLQYTSCGEVKVGGRVERAYYVSDRPNLLSDTLWVLPESAVVTATVVN